MKSDVCRIDKGTKDLAAIFSECEKVASYNGLSTKQALQLRLLCEELDGMLPNVIDDFDGELWIEYEDGEAKVNVSITIPELDIVKKEELIKVAKSKKNAAAVGIVGKIRSAIEDFLLDEHAVKTLATSPETQRPTPGYSASVDYSYLWSLDSYKNSVSKEEEAWDELEKSVIASVADDVIVGVKGKQADIVVIKKFA